MSNVWITDKDFSCSLAATSNITLSGLYTLDGVAITTGMTVLAAGQTDSTASGPYIAKLGAWDRVVSLATGQQFYIALGSTNGTKIFELQTPVPFTVGVTSLSFVTPIVSGTPPIGTAGGNLSGSYPNPKVIKVQDEAVSATPPTDGQIWVYDGVTTNSWVPTTLMTLAANAGSIQDAPVAVTAPVDGQALIYNGSSYVPASFPLQKENTLPPPASSVDYISGSAGASAFTTAGGSAALVTVSGTAVSRGASWTAAGTVRFDSTSRPGWILIQPSTDDGANSFIWHYPLTGGSPTDIGLFLVNSFDDYSAKTDIASITFAFSQTLMGSIDTDNAYLVVITSTAVANQWTIATSIKVAGAVTAISSETLTSPTYPCPLICIEKHSSNFRSWFGLDKNFPHI